MIPEERDDTQPNAKGSNLKKRVTITEQVQQLHKNNQTFKKDVLTIIQRIVSTFLNWELFSDKEISDATRAFSLIGLSFHFSCFADEQIIKSIMKILSSNSTPLRIKISTVS